MPRKAREKSSTGIYAVLIEGVDKIFLDDEDYGEFIERIDDYLDLNAIAFALIHNAACLIVKESDGGIGLDIKPLTTSYARYYGSRYDSNGGVFKQRFKSLPIESAEDMAKNLACIHKLCDTLGEEGYTGRYDGDELFIPEAAVTLMGGLELYNELMDGDNALAELFVQLSGEKPERKKPERKAAAKKSTSVRAKKKTVKENAAPVKKETAVIEKPEPAAEEVKAPDAPKKKKKMPTWLL